jgi:hypothetical protein
MVKVRVMVRIRVLDCILVWWVSNKFKLINVQVRVRVKFRVRVRVRVTN